MDVQCPKCDQTVIIRRKLGESEKLVTHCPTCETAFIIKRKPRSDPPEQPPGAVPPAATPPPGAGNTWLIRKQDGTVLSFQSIRTLQTWVIAGIVSTDDFISRKGIQWRRVGSLPELASFIEKTQKLYEDARPGGGDVAPPPSPAPRSITGPAFAAVEEDVGGAIVPVIAPSQPSPSGAPSSRRERAAREPSGSFPAAESSWSSQEIPSARPPLRCRVEASPFRVAVLLVLLVGVAVAGYLVLTRHGPRCDGEPARYAGRHDAPTWPRVAPRPPRTPDVSPLTPEVTALATVPASADIHTGPAAPPVPEAPPADVAEEPDVPGVVATDGAGFAPPDRSTTDAGAAPADTGAVAVAESANASSAEDTAASRRTPPRERSERDRTPRTPRAERTRTEPAPRARISEGYEQHMEAAHELFSSSPARAAVHYARAARSSPGAVEPVSQLGWCHLRTGQTSKAFQYFKKAIKMGPGYADAYRGLARAYEQAGYREEACRNYGRYLRKIRSTSSRARQTRARMERLGCSPSP